MVTRSLAKQTTADHTYAETDSAEHDRAVDNVGDGEAAHGCEVVVESKSGGRTISGGLVLDFLTEFRLLSAHLRTRRRVKSSELS